MPQVDEAVVTSVIQFRNRLPIPLRLLPTFARLSESSLVVYTGLWIGESTYKRKRSPNTTLERVSFFVYLCSCVSSPFFSYSSFLFSSSFSSYSFFSFSSFSPSFSCLSSSVVGPNVHARVHVSCKTGSGQQKFLVFSYGESSRRKPSSLDLSQKSTNYFVYFKFVHGKSKSWRLYNPNTGFLNCRNTSPIIYGPRKDPSVTYIQRTNYSSKSLRIVEKMGKRYITRSFILKEVSSQSRWKLLELFVLQTIYAVCRP